MKNKVVYFAILVLSITVSFSGCNDNGGLSPARDITGVWFGTLTSSDNNLSCSNIATMDMLLNIEMDNNKNVTGYLQVYLASGAVQGVVTGHVDGVHVYMTSYIGNGCIDIHGTFTSTNMEGMKGSSPPPYLSCGETLNNGHGSKGIEFHLKYMGTDSTL
jgi:hypothetical protein